MCPDVVVLPPPSTFGQLRAVLGLAGTRPPAGRFEPSPAAIARCCSDRLLQSARSLEIVGLDWCARLLIEDSYELERIAINLEQGRWPSPDGAGSST